jgi:HSP20 family protein
MTRKDKERQEQTVQTTESPRQGGLARRETFMPSPITNPFAFMRRFTEEMDRLFEDFFGGSLIPRWTEFGSLSEFRERMWSPQIEVFERDNQLVVRADLPGLTKDDVHVEITDDSLIIQGERKQEHEERREGFYRSERSYGRFYREIPLPEGVNAENATATFRNGVLEITLQVPERQPRGRRIEIKEATETGQEQAQAAGRSQ